MTAQLVTLSYATPTTAQEAMWGGFLAFGLCSLWGLHWLVRGLRGDIHDSTGHALASRQWFIGGVILLQLPLIGFAIFAWKQGLFA